MSYESLIADAAGYHDLQGAVTDGPAPHLPNATNFNGATDFVDAGDLGVCEDHVFTYAIWVRSTSTLVSFVVSEGNTSTSRPLIGLRLSGTDTRAWLRNDANQGVTLFGPGIADGLWHSIAQTCDGTTCQLYIDGVLEASGAAPAVNTPVNMATIGALRREASSSFFDGDLAGGLLSNHHWSAQDVTDYHAGPIVAATGNRHSLDHTIDHSVQQ